MFCTSPAYNGLNIDTLYNKYSRISISRTRIFRILRNLKLLYESKVHFDCFLQPYFGVRDFFKSPNYPNCKLICTSGNLKLCPHNFEIWRVDCTLHTTVLYHLSRVLTKKLVRVKYKEHIGRDLSTDEKETINSIVYKFISESAAKQRVRVRPIKKFCFGQPTEVFKFYERNRNSCKIMHRIPYTH